MSPSIFTQSKVALDIENSSLRLLMVHGNRVQGWMSYPLQSDLFQDGALPSPEPLRAALASFFFGREDVKGRTSVCFPAGRSFFRIIELPRLGSRMAAQAIMREAQRELPVDGEDLHLFWQMFHSTRARRHYLVVGVRKETYGSLHAALKQARMRPAFWELKPLALLRAIGRPDVIILDLEKESTDLVLAAQGAPRLVRSLPPATDLPLEERVRRWAAEIARSTEYYLGAKPDSGWDPKTPVVVTGQLAVDRQVPAALQAACQQPVQPFQSPLDASPMFPAAAYAAAIGLALKRGRPGPMRRGLRTVDFDVLPQQYVRPVVSAQKASLVAGVVFGAALLVPGFHLKAQGDARQAEQQTELARLQRQVTVTKANLVKRGDIQKATDQAIETTHALQDERQSILALGGDLARDLRGAMDLAPAGVTIVRTSSRSDDMVVEGQAQDYPAVLQYVRAVEDSGRFERTAITSLTKSADASKVSTAAFVLSLSRHIPAAPLETVVSSPQGQAPTGPKS